MGQSMKNNNNNIQIAHLKIMSFKILVMIMSSKVIFINSLIFNLTLLVEFHADDTIVCLYSAVKRTTSRYKCLFTNCIVQIGGREMIIPKIQADIDY